MENRSQIRQNKWNKIISELWLIWEVAKPLKNIPEVDKRRNLRRKINSVWVQEKKKLIEKKMNERKNVPIYYGMGKR